MSTDYLPRYPIPFEQIKGIELETVKEHITENTTPDNCCLTDGDNHLWSQKSASGFTTFTRFGSNSAEDILDALAIDYEEYVGSLADGITAFKDGRVDAFFKAAPGRSVGAAHLDVMTRISIRLLSITKDEIKKVQALI